MPSRIFLCSLFAMLCTVLMGHAAYAQTLAPDLSITTIPLDPQPSQQVTLQVQSYGLDLDQSLITWKYNDQVVSSAIGKTSISVIAPANGQTGTISVATGGATGGSATILLRPASVDMLWEAADSYTPPFYKGKALLAVNGLVRVTAIPTASAPAHDVYSWSRNDSVDQSNSGYDKSSFIFTNDSINPSDTISAIVSSGGFSGQSTVTISPFSPQLIAYQNNEGYIDYAHGMSGDLSVSGSGAIIHFEPYFFSVPSTLSNSLAFQATIDGAPYTLTPPENELSFSNPENNASAKIDFSVNTVARTLQNIEKVFTLNFN